jgi:Gpi16 subunit, GPI transamidase component
MIRPHTTNTIHCNMLGTSSFRRTERITIVGSGTDTSIPISPSSWQNPDDPTLFVRWESQSSHRPKDLRGRQTQSDGAAENDNEHHHHHPLLSRDAVELLTKYQAVRVHMQVASIASQQFPESLLDTIEPRNEHKFVGPPGVSVAVDFLTTASSHDDKDEDLLLHFQSLLNELAGHRRVLIAPLHTIRRPGLHRWVEISNVTTSSVVHAMRVQTVLPMEGAATAFSVEGLQSFLHQARGGGLAVRRSGIWNCITALEWSSWLLGSVPSTLEQAQTAMSNDPIATAADKSTWQRSHHRRGFWMDWKASPGCHVRRTSNDGDCLWETEHGIQYALTVPRGRLSSDIRLNDILPTFSPPQHQDDGGTFQSDVFADESMLELLGTAQWSRDAACSIPESTLNRSTIGTLDDALQAHNRSRPCLVWHHEPLTNVPDAAPPSQWWWSVQYHAARTVGQGYRGSLSVRVANHHTACAARVTVTQTIPAVLEPQWQSLSATLFTEVKEYDDREDSTEARSGRNQRKRIRLSWNALDDFNVDFRSNGSIQLSFQHVLPTRSTLELWFDYQPSFLSHESFPGDANRGFELPPVQATFHVPVDSANTCASPVFSIETSPTILYSNALLILAPLPDMSMPFNVISLTCTLYAFVIGSLLNLLIKKVSVQLKAQLDPDKAKPQGLIALLKSKIKTRFSKRSIVSAPTVPKSSTPVSAATTGGPNLKA